MDRIEESTGTAETATMSNQAAAVLSAVFTSEAHRKSKRNPQSRRSSYGPSSSMSKSMSSIGSNLDWQLRIVEILDGDSPSPTSSFTMRRPSDTPSSSVDDDGLNSSSSSSSRSSGNGSSIVKSRHKNNDIRSRRHSIQGPISLKTNPFLKNKKGNSPGPNSLAPSNDDDSRHEGPSSSNKMESKRVIASASRTTAGASSSNRVMPSQTRKMRGGRAPSPSSESSQGSSSDASYKYQQIPFDFERTAIYAKSQNFHAPFRNDYAPKSQRKLRRASAPDIPPVTFPVMFDLDAARGALRDHFNDVIVENVAEEGESSDRDRS